MNRNSPSHEGERQDAIGIRPLRAIGEPEIRGLSKVLIDCVEGGASVSFMSRTIIRDCRVWDGSGAAAVFPADVLIEGARIGAVAHTRGQLDGTGAEVIEARGMSALS